MRQMLRISLMSAWLLGGYILYAREPAKRCQYPTQGGNRQPVATAVDKTLASDGSHPTAHSQSHR